MQHDTFWVYDEARKHSKGVPERSVDAEVRRRNMSCKYMTRILQQECQSILEFCSTLFSGKEWKDERRILYGKPEKNCMKRFRRERFLYYFPVRRQLKQTMSIIRFLQTEVLSI